MHVQVSRVIRNGKTYEYARLVESFRKPNGIPALRVIAQLGAVDAVTLGNLRTTLKASRAGKRVFAERSVASAQPLKPAQNLRFLDLAVLLELSQQFGLTRLLEEVLPRGEADVSPSDVVLALSLQRCVDAGSKLYAERWFPRTALAELLHIAPSSFHNTRIHRVLDTLDDATESLMRKLPLLYAKQAMAASAMFLDCTDARFVGRGPELAEVCKTKEGLFERKVGIVLLCNEHGLPLRWEVIAGKKAEAPAMHQMLETIRGLGWVGRAPIVIDRIMGASAEVQKLLALAIRFVTAARPNEFAAYAPKIPYALLEDLRCTDDAQLDACAHEATERMREAGFTEVGPTLWVEDLGVVERDAPLENTITSEQGHGVRALRLAREIQRLVDEGETDSLRSAGRRLGLKNDLAKSYRKLLRLDLEIQHELLAGKFAGVSIGQLLRVASLPVAHAQRQMLEGLVIVPPPTAAPGASQAIRTEPKPDNARIRVRAVVCFNPDRFARERRAAQLLLDTVHASVRELNQGLADPRSRRTPKQVERAVERMLERKKACDLYEVHVSAVSESDRTRYTVHVELKQTHWQKRCRYHGFALILGHPELEQSAAQIAQLYRDKDRVEKDFQTIKSLIKLRPIWHHTNQKVRAHVTICVLALLLERLLDRGLGSETTSGEALETLATCQLNRFNGHRTSHYLVTEPNREQRMLLRALGLEHLVDDDALATQTQPRPASL